MQTPTTPASSPTPSPLDVDGLTVLAFSHAKLRSESRRDALLRGEPPPTELRQIWRNCPVCDEPMLALRNQPGVDDLDLEELVGEGPFDLLVCRHRHELWHAQAQVLLLHLRHGLTCKSHRIKRQIASRLETLVNTSLGRPGEVETDRSCELCRAKLVRRPHSFSTHGVAAAMMHHFDWSAVERCPNFSPHERHTVLRR